jgi:hypothetical protein
MLVFGDSVHCAGRHSQLYNIFGKLLAHVFHFAQLSRQRLVSLHQSTHPRYSIGQLSALHPLNRGAAALQQEPLAHNAQ